MAQTLEFSATDGMTLTATRCAVGAYTGTAADSVTQQSGTNRYLAVFTTEVSGAYRLDVASGGTAILAEVYDLSGSGTFQPRSEPALPVNFSALGINASGHVSRVTLVDTTTTNTDMRGTDGAYTGTPPTALAIADAVWDEATSGHATAGTTGKALTDAGSSTSVTVLPATGTEISRVSGTAIQLFTAELITVAVGVTDSAGVAVDLTGMTLELIFESGSTEVVIADAAITKTTSSFSFVATSTLTASERLWKWALRKTTDESVIVNGTLEVVYSPNN